MELNFERIEMQKWNIPTDRAERVDGQNGVICLVIMFILRVMVIKMSKMAHFLYFQLIPAKNQSQFKCIFTCIWKILFSSLGKMLWIVGSWATISNTSTLEDKDFHYFLLTQQFFLYFYRWCLWNGNSKNYALYHFLKELKKIF